MTGSTHTLQGHVRTRAHGQPWECLPTRLAVRVLEAKGRWSLQKVLDGRSECGHVVPNTEDPFAKASGWGHGPSQGILPSCPSSGPTNHSLHCFQHFLPVGMESRLGKPSACGGFLRVSTEQLVGSVCASTPCAPCQPGPRQCLVSGRGMAMLPCPPKRCCLKTFREQTRGSLRLQSSWLSTLALCRPAVGEVL